MTEKQLYRLISKSVGRYTRRFGLSGWSIDVHLVESLDGRQAQVHIQPLYRQALIELVPGDEEIMDRAVRHELLHLVLAPLEAFEELLEKHTDNKVLHSVLVQVNEQLVNNVEMILDGTD